MHQPNENDKHDEEPIATDSESGSGDPGRTPGKAEGVEEPEKKGNE
jgi:hypothetical protein